MSQVHNALVQTKLSVDRCLLNLAHIQSMFLFCEPRNMGMEAEITDNVINMIHGVRKELRQSHELLNKGIEGHEERYEVV